jgi:hypothetical protein
MHFGTVFFTGCQTVLFPLPRMLPTKLQFTWQSGFRGEDFLRNQPIRNKNCLWRPCLLMDQNKIRILYRGPSIDASYQVSFAVFRKYLDVCTRSRDSTPARGCEFYIVTKSYTSIHIIMKKRESLKAGKWKFGKWKITYFFYHIFWMRIGRIIIWTVFKAYKKLWNYSDQKRNRKWREFSETQNEV